jgi:multidrug resistance protein, MATE family
MSLLLDPIMRASGQQPEIIALANQYNLVIILLADPDAACLGAAQFRLRAGPPDLCHRCHRAGHRREWIGQLRFDLRQARRARGLAWRARPLRPSSPRCSASAPTSSRSGLIRRCIATACSCGCSRPIGSDLRSILKIGSADCADSDSRGRDFRRGGFHDGQFRRSAARRAHGRAATGRARLSGPLRRWPGRRDPGRLFLRRARSGRHPARRLGRSGDRDRLHGDYRERDGARARTAAQTIYVDPADMANAALVGFALQYLLLAAIFQLADGVQAVAAGALRGLQDTRVPMWIAIFSYWVPGIGLAVGLGFFTPLEGVGCVDRPCHRLVLCRCPADPALDKPARSLALRERAVRQTPA